MVREAAVDLVGKFILHREELIDRYYGMLSDRIMVSTVVFSAAGLDIIYALSGLASINRSS
mgnify:FL=1